MAKKDNLKENQENTPSEEQNTKILCQTIDEHKRRHPSMQIRALVASGDKPRKMTSIHSFFRKRKKMESEMKKERCERDRGERQRLKLKYPN